MKRPIALLAGLVFTICTQAQQLIDSRTREIVFRNVNLVAMDSNRVQLNKTVVTRNGKIVSVTDASRAKVSAGAQIIDGKDKFLMPGLAEMHAHVPPIDDLSR